MPRRESHINVNVTPNHEFGADTPEIRKYKKRFNSEILCAALWGVNLLIGTENGLMLLDRSGQGEQLLRLCDFHLAFFSLSFSFSFFFCLSL